MSYRLAPARILLPVLLASLPVSAGVRKEIEQRYQGEYVNRALTLKRPVRGEDQPIVIGQPGGRLDTSTLGSTLLFKVGDQVRITRVDFRDHEVRFDIESPDRTRSGRITFLFTTELTHSFPQQADFDSALAATFTEALSYREVDKAKSDFIRSEFEEMVRRFVGTTSTSREFVMETLAGLNPDYQKAIERAQAEGRRADRIEGQVEEAQRSARAARQELEEARRAQASTESRLNELRSENEQSRGRSESLARDVARLRESNTNYEQQISRLEGQINGLSDKLGLEVASRNELGSQVENLTRSVDSLQKERGSLSDQLTRVNVQLGQLQDDKARLTGELEASKNDNQRLQRNYERLTGDKNTVTARLANTAQERDHLETVRELEQALAFDLRESESENGRMEAGVFRLGEHEIGRLEVEPPARAGDTGAVRLHLDSPDKVVFSERERELFESLGAPWRVRAEWVPDDDSITSQPREGEPVQELAQRETASWRSQLAGQPDTPSRVTFRLTATGPGDLEVALLKRDYVVRPAGLTARLGESFSWVSLLGGLLLGAVAALVLGSRRTTPAPRNRRHPERVEEDPGAVRKGL